MCDQYSLFLELCNHKRRWIVIWYTNTKWGITEMYVARGFQKH